MSPYDKSSVGLCGRRPIARLGKAKRRRNRTRLLCCEPLEARQLLASTAAFTETMAATAVKPWTGTGAVNAWTVTGSYLEQRTEANYGSGNACGMEYKGGTTLNALTGAMLATTKRHQRGRRVGIRRVLGPVVGSGRDRRLDLPA